MTSFGAAPCRGVGCVAVLGLGVSGSRHGVVFGRAAVAPCRGVGVCRGVGAGGCRFATWRRVRAGWAALCRGVRAGGRRFATWRRVRAGGPRWRCVAVLGLGVAGSRHGVLFGRAGLRCAVSRFWGWGSQVRDMASCSGGLGCAALCRGFGAGGLRFATRQARQRQPRHAGELGAATRGRVVSWVRRPATRHGLGRLGG